MENYALGDFHPDHGPREQFIGVIEMLRALPLPSPVAVQAVPEGWNFDMGAAPKDGSPIVLCFDLNVNFISHQGRVGIAFWSTDGSADWFTAEWESHPLTAFSAKPTAWMPLPSPVGE